VNAILIGVVSSHILHTFQVTPKLSIGTGTVVSSALIIILTTKLLRTVLAASLPNSLSSSGETILMFLIIAQIAQAPIRNIGSNLNSTIQSFNCSADLAIGYLDEVHNEYSQVINSMAKELSHVGTEFQKIHSQLTKASELPSQFLNQVGIIQKRKIDLTKKASETCVLSMAESYKECEITALQKWESCLKHSSLTFMNLGLCDIIKLGRKTREPLRKLDLCMPVGNFTTFVKLFLIQQEETLRIFHESYNPHWVNSPLQKNRNSKLPELTQLLSSTFEAGYEAVQVIPFVTYMESSSFKETTQAVVKSLDGFYIISIGVRFSYFLMHTSLSLIIVLFDQLLSRILLEVRRETSFEKCKIPEIALTETYNIIIIVIVILHIMVWVGFVFQTRILYLKLQVFRYNISNE
jgi:hypothetical protein